MKRRFIFFYTVLFCVMILMPLTSIGAPKEEIHPDERCSICGMFVAKYEDWITQVQLSDESVMFFDGVKDMLVFYFNTAQYSKFEQKDIREIWVKDYYTLQWFDGLKAFYVIGSDVYGPMGMEFIAFATKDAAENFMKDHKGKQVVAFDEITDELVQSMRTTKMKH